MCYIEMAACMTFLFGSNLFRIVSYRMYSLSYWFILDLLDPTLWKYHCIVIVIAAIHSIKETVRYRTEPYITFTSGIATRAVNIDPAVVVISRRFITDYFAQIVSSGWASLLMSATTYLFRHT